MDLQEIRSQIDIIDDQLVHLFTKRMELSAQVAAYKKEHNLPIYVPAREREILLKVEEMAGSDMAQYVRVLYSVIFELSRTYQSERNHSEDFNQLINKLGTLCSELNNIEVV